MLFTSYAFFGFAGLLLLLYYLIPARGQWKLLLAASCLFYLVSGPQNLIYIFVTAVTTYFTALRIQRSSQEQKAYLKARRETLSKEDKRAYKERCKRVRVRCVTVCLLLNLALLALMKYANFFIGSLNGLLAAAGQTRRLSFLSLAVPLGISFYTFQSIGYLIDVYRGTVPAEKSFFRFALFVSFFPQLIQGPISRFEDLSRTLYEPHPYSREVLCRGLQRVLWGYFKKLVVADRLLPAVVLIGGDAESYGGAYVLVEMLLYTLQLYSDFTGGIDITVGLAESLGVTVQENFNRPYFSKSLKEYWRRWHISMGTWFRDYLFYPISVSRPMQRLSRFSKRHLGRAVSRRLPVYLSSFATWFATGIWHGASWNFILWGLSNWAVLMISEELEPLYLRFHRRFPRYRGTLAEVFRVGRTFLLVSCLKLFDCYRTLPELLWAAGSVFTARNWHILWDGALLKLKLSGTDFAIVAAGALLMLTVSLLQRRQGVRERVARLPFPVRFVLWYGLFLTVLLAGAYGVGYDASQFIYNRF